ncbi:hypothetical protein HYPBUDRAFT_108399 [Hyphopichia burtonii NRRL Y-1933]|uniref:Uncharacterized protein n=1 Tax=Hyphopichia burtonii NRRL Y-1933 TaxID=984485 RepID=A0A1E4RK10_9ASCO|nr:hypothetical protein HYPBUDRAFT_108399 [Hyphopichia burtonii NRRL Y-1933]ODV67618.1 hypothetical protein HYPBUDRAFT_108399 [Hyphopichia burtonii NRRL Y-1933]
MLDTIITWVKKYDETIVTWLSAHHFTSNLVTTRISVIISEILFASFVLLLSYETVYWSGIYLGLWEYHAKDIFTEVPVHCAHVYVRLNLIDSKDNEFLQQYYTLRQSSPFNVLNWTKTNQLAANLFKLPRFIKYHFEMSPEDFENNPEPEFGSTIEHLRGKILHLFNTSDFYRDFRKNSQSLSKHDVRIYNNKNIEVKEDQDLQYLSKVHIETGNVIDSVICL